MDVEAGAAVVGLRHLFKGPVAEGQSNMGNGVGCSPVLQLLKRGITVGLGTDAYTNDVLESAKTALAIQRHNVLT